jgi:hypothetical protein
LLVAYPGEPRTFTINGGSEVSGATILAQGAVSLLLLGMN